MAARRLLIGFDGGDGGRDALELGRLFATVLEAEAEVAPVLSYAAEMELTQRAEEEGADLIVVGSPHRGPIGRVLAGSAADRLLHGAPCPVAVAPRGFAAERREPFRTVAVAHDGTPESAAALRRAEAIALAARARIRVLTAVAPVVPVPGQVGYVPPQPPHPDRVLAAAVDSLDSRLAAEGRRLDGPPARALAEACEEDVDLLVAGSRRYGPVLRVLLGSVSTQLVHEAPCPVLVVPRPQEEGAGAATEEGDGPAA